MWSTHENNTLYSDSLPLGRRISQGGYNKSAKKARQNVHETTRDE